MGKTSPFLAIALMAVVFFVVLFMIGLTVLAAAFTNKGGGGGGGAGSLDGDCDYDKIKSEASAGKAQGQSTIRAKLSAPNTKKPPAKFVSIYEDISEKKKLGGCGPSILAAIHSIETSFADTGYSVVNSSGAGGPWQFLSGSWTGFAGDCDEGGSRSWPAYSVENGACAAANHLRGPDKAPKNWYNGIHSYNRVNWYVYAVAGLAEEYAKGGK